MADVRKDAIEVLVLTSFFLIAWVKIIGEPSGGFDLLKMGIMFFVIDLVAGNILYKLRWWEGK